ncbi:MAG: hypothetical protein AB1758_24630 [Candidatus Eremiobacterota bacterium]
MRGARDGLREMELANSFYKGRQAGYSALKSLEDSVRPTPESRAASAFAAAVSRNLKNQYYAYSLAKSGLKLIASGVHGPVGAAVARVALQAHGESRDRRSAQSAMLLQIARDSQSPVERNLAEAIDRVSRPRLTQRLATEMQEVGLKMLARGTSGIPDQTVAAYGLKLLDPEACIRIPRSSLQQLLEYLGQSTDDPRVRAVTMDALQQAGKASAPDDCVRTAARTAFKAICELPPREGSPEPWSQPPPDLLSEMVRLATEPSPAPDPGETELKQVAKSGSSSYRALVTPCEEDWAGRAGALRQTLERMVKSSAPWSTVGILASATLEATSLGKLKAWERANLCRSFFEAVELGNTTSTVGSLAALGEAALKCGESEVSGFNMAMCYLRRISACAPRKVEREFAAAVQRSLRGVSYSFAGDAAHVAFARMKAGMRGSLERELAEYARDIYLHADGAKGDKDTGVHSVLNSLADQGDDPGIRTLARCVADSSSSLDDTAALGVLAAGIDQLCEQTRSGLDLSSLPEFAVPLSQNKLAVAKKDLEPLPAPPPDRVRVQAGTGEIILLGEGKEPAWVLSSTRGNWPVVHRETLQMVAWLRPWGQEAGLDSNGSVWRGSGDHAAGLSPWSGTMAGFLVVMPNPGPPTPSEPRTPGRRVG